jgi:hypothetical protein
VLVAAQHTLDGATRPPGVSGLLEGLRGIELSAGRCPRCEPLAGFRKRSDGQLGVGSPPFDVRGEERQRRLQSFEQRQDGRRLSSREGYASPNVSDFGPRLLGLRQRFEGVPGSVPLLVAHERRPRHRHRGRGHGRWR